MPAFPHGHVPSGWSLEPVLSGFNASDRTHSQTKDTHSFLSRLLLRFRVQWGTQDGIALKHIFFPFNLDIQKSSVLNHLNGL
jgi:hypothetical protein